MPHRWSDKWRKSKSVHQIHLDLAEQRLDPTRVLLLGVAMILIGVLGFYYLPGMIDEDASGSHVINSLYCSVMTLTTVGFGDICPSATVSPLGEIFIVLYAFTGLGMFLGPIMDLASSWKNSVPGGPFMLISTTIAIGIFLFTWIEDMTELEAAYFSVITGTTIGFGDMHPNSDLGKVAVAAYAILVINVMGALLEPAKNMLQSFCYARPTIKQARTVPPIVQDGASSSTTKED